MLVICVTHNSAYAVNVNIQSRVAHTDISRAKERGYAPYVSCIIVYRDVNGMHVMLLMS